MYTYRHIYTHTHIKIRSYRKHIYIHNLPCLRRPRRLITTAFHSCWKRCRRCCAFLPPTPLSYLSTWISPPAHWGPWGVHSPSVSGDSGISAAGSRPPALTTILGTFNNCSSTKTPTTATVSSLRTCPPTAPRNPYFTLQAHLTSNLLILLPLHLIFSVPSPWANFFYKRSESKYFRICKP